jgi:hypothetical protein
MAVWVDNSRGSHFHRGRVMRLSHMIADSPDELRDFAARIGLRPNWLQKPGTPHEHYDVTDCMRIRAINLGAIPIGAVAMGQKMLARGLATAARRKVEDPEFL